MDDADWKGKGLEVPGKGLGAMVDGRLWLPKREGTTKWEARWGWHHNSNLRLDDGVVGSAARSSGKAGGRTDGTMPRREASGKGPRQR